MSLFDYLNNDNSSTSTNSVTSLLQQIAAQQGISVSSSTLDALGGSTTGTSTPSVLISANAQAAGAEATDAKKSVSDLETELRATLDQQYTTNGSKTPDVTAFSGRALSVVALNQDGKFSRAEVDAAKAQLRERDRESAIAFLNAGDVTATSLKAYGQQLIAARQSMSAEEQQLRASDPDLR